MNYNETYELRLTNGDHPCGLVLDRFHEEKWALEALELESRKGSGAWRVVRVMEVTVASVFKA